MIGYNPCGFAVDMLRSCYTTKARLCRGSPRQSTITWFFTPKPPLPYLSAINSLNWTDISERVDLGEVGEVPGAARPYYDGAPPVGFDASSLAPWGDQKDFEQGGLVTLLPVPLGPDGLPVCCGPCQWGTELYGKEISVNVSGYTDGLYDLSILNGSWPITHPPGPSCDGVYFSVPPRWSVAVSYTAGILVVTFTFPVLFPLVLTWAYSLDVGDTVPAGDIVLPLASPVDPTWGHISDTIILHVPFDCGADLSQVLMTEAGDELQTELGVDIFIG